MSLTWNGRNRTESTGERLDHAEPQPAALDAPSKAPDGKDLALWADAHIRFWFPKGGERQ